MTGRVILSSGFSVLLLVFPIEAQFIGDALAAAGVAATEQQAAAAIGSLRGASAPPAGGTMTSNAPQSASVSEPSKLGTDVGIKRPSTTAASGSPNASSGVTTITGAPASSASQRPSQPQVGGSSGFAGARLQAETIDPAALASWQSAMSPVGAKVATLSSSATSVSSNGKSYEYDKGVFYVKEGSSYVAVRAPLGAAIQAKPLGASTTFANGKPHIYYFGTFYVYDGAQRAYVVVTPPTGAMVDYLPDTATKVEWEGAVHYRYAGTYYQPFYRGSSLAFRVAG